MRRPNKNKNDGVLSLIQTLLMHFYIVWAFLDVSGFPSNLPTSGTEQELRKARECLLSFATESYAMNRSVRSS
jgi:hypothetical protein